MVKISIQYQGEKHCELLHLPSNSRIATDAPKDNNGKGELFSPTDLVAAAMGSCMLTVMGILADKEAWIINGSHAAVTKEMSPPPRRIARLTCELHLPAKLTSDQRARLEEAALGCPVKRSLHPDVEIPVRFTYDI